MNNWSCHKASDVLIRFLLTIWAVRERCLGSDKINDGTSVESGARGTVKTFDLGLTIQACLVYSDKMIVA